MKFLNGLWWLRNSNDHFETSSLPSVSKYPETKVYLITHTKKIYKKTTNERNFLITYKIMILKVILYLIF